MVRSEVRRSLLPLLSHSAFRVFFFFLILHLFQFSINFFIGEDVRLIAVLQDYNYRTKQAKTNL